ncbi:hypothetical protein [Sphingomonas phyllosphaerae]|uniref:hypothetical protein n=1 Tax=Sphingomonas phyllosphaerae TaxID=257003 RepID=UPI0003B62993|nr:hypothetical protein [Sphingomonas phyllosphaerae]
MRHFLAATALLTALPAAAQTGINGGIGTDLRDNRTRIDRERAADRLSRRDARRAQAEDAKTGELAERYAGDGRLSEDERAEIDNRTAAQRSILDAPARSGPKR